MGEWQYSRRQETASPGGVNIVAVIGTVAAMWCSWQLGNGVGWILLHGLFGWFYLLYLCAGCGGGFPPIGAP